MTYCLTFPWRETNLTLHVGVNKEQRAQTQAERKQRKQEIELIYAQKTEIICLRSCV